MLLIGVHGTSVAHMTALKVVRRLSAKMASSAKEAAVEDMVAEVEAVEVEEEEDVEEEVLAAEVAVVDVVVVAGDTEGMEQGTADEMGVKDLVRMKERTGAMMIAREEDPGHVHTDADPDAHQCKGVQMRNVRMVMTAEVIVGGMSVG